MSVSSVSTTQGALQNGGTITSSSSKGQLTMSDFFTLMAAQLQYQDPTNPTDDSQFMGQMAQFGMLEQMTNLTNSSNFSLASSIVGKNVSYSTYDSETGTSTRGSGTVDAVDLTATTPRCLVNGSWQSMSDIQTIGNTSSATSA